MPEHHESDSPQKKFAQLAFATSYILYPRAALAIAWPVHALSSAAKLYDAAPGAPPATSLQCTYIRPSIAISPYPPRLVHKPPINPPATYIPYKQPLIAPSAPHRRPRRINAPVSNYSPPPPPLPLPISYFFPTAQATLSFQSAECTECRCLLRKSSHSRR